MAPEFYEPLHAHRSLTRVLLLWLFDRKLDLYTRITREREVVPLDSEQAARLERAALA